MLRRTKRKGECTEQAAEAEREARHAEHERAARRAEAERGKLKKRGAIMVVGDMQRAREVAASLGLPEVKWMERRPRVQRSYFDCHYV